MRSGPWWRARKEGRRVGAESLGSKMWLGDESAGRVRQRNSVNFGSGEGKNCNEGRVSGTEKEGVLMRGGNRLLMQMALCSPTPPGISRQNDFAGHPHHHFPAHTVPLFPCSGHGNPSY